MDFIKFDNIVYFRTNHVKGKYQSPVGSEGLEEAGRPLTESDLGREYAEVRFEAQSNPISSQVGNGAAAYHAPGKPVYTVKGYDPTFRLAVRQDERWALYEPVRNPGAQRGSDFLDIGGKVSRIGVAGRGDRVGESTVAGEPREVEPLVRGLMDAPLERKSPEFFHGGEAETRSLVFHLKDGTAVVREYRTGPGLLGSGGSLSPGIETPEEFGEAVKKTLSTTKR